MCKKDCKETPYKAISKNFTFKLAGIVWKVLFVDSVSEGEFLGICDYPTFTIAIDKHQSAVQQKLTLLHELNHAFTRSCMTQDNVNIEHMADSIAEGQLEVVPQLLRKIPCLFSKDVKVDKEVVG